MVSGILLSGENGYAISRLFGLDAQLLADSLLMIIAVFFLFLIMSYVLFNPARKMLEGRSNKIKTELENAARDEKEAADHKAEYEAKLKEADKEVEAILADARKRASANEAKIEAEARTEAARILEQAHKEAELEKKKAVDEAKNEIIEIATAMAAKIVSQAIDVTVQNSLIDETLKEIGEGTWQS